MLGPNHTLQGREHHNTGHFGGDFGSIFGELGLARRKRPILQRCLPNLANLANLGATSANVRSWCVGDFCELGLRSPKWCAREPTVEPELGGGSSGVVANLDRLPLARRRRAMKVARRPRAAAADAAQATGRGALKESRFVERPGRFVANDAHEEQMSWSDRKETHIMCFVARDHSCDAEIEELENNRDAEEALDDMVADTKESSVEVALLGCIRACLWSAEGATPI